MICKNCGSGPLIDGSPIFFDKESGEYFCEHCLPVTVENQKLIKVVHDNPYLNKNKLN